MMMTKIPMILMILMTGQCKVKTSIHSLKKFSVTNKNMNSSGHRNQHNKSLTLDNNAINNKERLIHYLENLQLTLRGTY
jgi:hypothetical protein